MTIEHPFDSCYVHVVHILLWSTALVHFTSICTYLRNDPSLHRGPWKDMALIHNTRTIRLHPDTTLFPLVSCKNFFRTKTLEEFSIGRGASGVLSFAIFSEFAVVAHKDTSPGADGVML